MVPDSSLQEHNRSCTLKEYDRNTKDSLSTGVKPNAADMRRQPPVVRSTRNQMQSTLKHMKK